MPAFRVFYRGSTACSCLLHHTAGMHYVSQLGPEAGIFPKIMRFVTKGMIWDKLPDEVGRGGSKRLGRRRRGGQHDQPACLPSHVTPSALSHCPVHPPAPTHPAV